MNVTELKFELIRRGIPEDMVSLGDHESGRDECYCLMQARDKWIVFYAERGLKSGLVELQDEPTACEHFLELVTKDASR